MIVPRSGIWQTLAVTAISSVLLSTLINVRGASAHTGPGSETTAATQSNDSGHPWPENRCGPKGLSRLVPDFGFGNACAHHDGCYGGHTNMEFNRRQCDDKFLSDMTLTCLENYEGPKASEPCLNIAKIFYTFVRSKIGQSAWHRPTVKTRAMKGAHHLCLDVPHGDTTKQLIIWPCHDKTNQLFEFSNNRIVHIKSGKCIDIKGNKAGPGTAVGLSKCHEGPNQSWTYTNGAIRSKSTDLCLDIKGGWDRAKAGTVVIAYTCRTRTVHPQIGPKPALNQEWDLP